MNVVILSAGTGWHTDELCRALAERGHTGRVLPYERLVARLGSGRRRRCADCRTASHAILDADAVLARIIPSGSLEQIIYRVDALHWIEERGVPVMNSPRAIERSVDKFYTTALLQEAGLPTPETVVCESTADAMAAVLAMGDVVIKPIFGSMGHGMVRVSDPDVAFRVVRAARAAARRVLRAARRRSRRPRRARLRRRRPGASARSNGRPPDGRLADQRVARRTARPFELPPAWEQLALRAAAAVGADYAGVDLLPSRDGRCSCSKSTASPAGRACSRPPASTWPARSWIIWPSASRAARSAASASRSSRHDCERRGARRPSRERVERRRRRQPRRSSPACSRSARRSRGTCRRAVTSPTRATRTSWPAPPRSARRLPAPARAARRDRPPRDRSHGALDALEHQSRHRAAAGAACARARFRNRRSALRDGVRRVLDATTVDDARDVYAAIRRAAPGGLGRVDAQDVADRTDDDAARRDAAGRRPRRDRARVRDRLRGHVRDRRAGARPGARATASPGTTRSSRRF